MKEEVKTVMPIVISAATPTAMVVLLFAKVPNICCLVAKEYNLGKYFQKVLEKTRSSVYNEVE